MSNGHHSESDDLISRITHDLEETRVVVLDAIQGLFQRGERIENLTDKTQHLMEQSERFEEIIRGPSSPSRARAALSILARGISHGVKWTAHKTLLFLNLVLYYAGRAGSLGIHMFSVMFPLHDGLSVERFDELDVYYDPHFEEESDWYDSEFAKKK